MTVKNNYFAWQVFLFGFVIAALTESVIQITRNYFFCLVKGNRLATDVPKIIQLNFFHRDANPETTAANLTAFGQTVKPKKCPPSAKKRKKQNPVEVTLQSVCVDSEVLCDTDLSYEKKSEEKVAMVSDDFADTEALALDSDAFLKVDVLNDSFSEIKTELPYANVGRKQNDLRDEDLKNEDDSLDDDKDLSEWLSNSELEKNEIFSFCCPYCSTVCAQEDDIISHVKTEHPEHENILR